MTQHEKIFDWMSMNSGGNSSGGANPYGSSYDN